MLLNYSQRTGPGLNTNPELEKIKSAGVVGMGGAGFPTHVKLNANVDTLLINAAECEPLLRKDNIVMQNYAESVAQGIKHAAELVGAKTVIIGIKSKNRASIEAMNNTTLGPAGSSLYQVFELRDFYPAGDEVTLVHQITGKVVPPAGLPLDVGVVVINNETALNIFDAINGQPVTHSFVTISGAVKNPATFKVELGCSFAELIEAAGGSTITDWVILDGGPMMGSIVEDPEKTVVKTSSGVIVLPRDHSFVEHELVSHEFMYKINKSVCDQCSLCTQLCPRYLLGHPLEPHMVMRQQFVVTFPAHSRWGQVCCECGLCSLYSCPEGLFPREACQDSKRSLSAIGDHFTGPKDAKPHPMEEFRHVPTKKLLQRIGLTEFDKNAPYKDFKATKKLRIQLSQHIGTPAIPTVNVGDDVSRNQIIATVPEGKLGAMLHSPRDTKVLEVNAREIVLR
jgi:Na+-translocating ferredoxin:NAD+ oxidoreductase RnfC subunit